MGVLDSGGGPSSVMDTPLVFVPLSNPFIPFVPFVCVPDWDLPEVISGDCCGSRTTFGVHSEEVCMM